MDDVARLLVNTWFPPKENVVEFIGYFSANQTKTGSMEKIQSVKTWYIELNGADQSQCVGVCTDEATAMTSKQSNGAYLKNSERKKVR